MIKGFGLVVRLYSVEGEENYAMNKGDNTYYERLLEHYLTNQLTPEEAEALKGYLESDPEFAEERREMYNANTLLVAQPRQGDATKGLHAYRKWRKEQRKRRRVRQLVQFAKYAAVVALLMLGGYLYGEYRANELLHQHVTEVQAPAGQRLLFTLNDGTTVHLSPCSRVSFDAAYGRSERRVELEGAAFFDVKKQSEKPFVVNTGERYGVEVTGTQFYLQSDNLEPFYLSLLEGGVEVFSEADTQEALVVSPGERVVLENGQLVKSPEQLSEIANRKHGIVQYRSTPLAEVFAEIGHWYNVRIIFATPELANHTLSGKIRQGDSLKSILEAISLSLSLRYEYLSDSTIRISE